jgi:hypothetical protein
MANYMYNELEVDHNTVVLSDTISDFVMRCIESIEDGRLLTVEDRDGNEIGCMDYILDYDNEIIFNRYYREFNSVERERYHGKVEGYRSQTPLYVRLDHLLVDLLYNSPVLTHDRYCSAKDIGGDNGELASCLYKVLDASGIGDFYDSETFFAAKNLDLSQPCYVDEHSGRLVSCFEMIFDDLRVTQQIKPLLMYHANVDTLTSDCSSGGEIVPCVFKIVNPSREDCNYGEHPALRPAYAEIFLEMMSVNPQIEDALKKPVFPMWDGSKSNWMDYVIEQNAESNLGLTSRRIMSKMITEGKIDLLSPNCTTTDTRESISCLDKILTTLEEVQDQELESGRIISGLSQTASLYSQIGKTVDGRIRNAVCHTRDGEPIQCIDRMMGIIERTYTMDFGTGRELLWRMADGVTASSVAARLISDLLSNSSINMGSIQCRDGDRQVSCLQRCIDILHNEAVMDRAATEGRLSIYDSTDNGYMAIVSDQDLTKPVCSIGGTSTSCVEYLLNKYQTKFGSVESFFNIPMNRVGMALSSYFNRLTPVRLGDGELDVRGELCEWLRVEDFEELDDDNDDEHREDKYMKVMGSCLCRTKADGTPLSAKEKRKCHDELCLELNDTFSDPNKEWISSLMERGTGLEMQDDPLGICGVYDISYVASRDSVKVETYRAGVAKVFETIQRLLRRNAITKRRGVDAVINLQLVDATDGSGDMVVVVTYRDAITNHEIESKTVKLSRLHRIPEVKQLFDRVPSLVEQLHKAVTQRPSSTAQNLKMVVSNRPYDLIRASSCQAWTSCFNMRNGCHNDTVRTFVEYGAYIVYIADDEWSPTWYSRLYLVPANGDRTCLMIQKPYGLPDYKRLVMDAAKTLLYENGCNSRDCTRQFPASVRRFPWSNELDGRIIDYEAMKDAARSKCEEDVNLRDDLYEKLIEGDFEYYTTEDREQLEEYIEEELNEIREQDFDPEIHESLEDVEITDRDRERAEERAEERLWEWVESGIDSDFLDEEVELKCENVYEIYMDELDEDDFNVGLDGLKDGYDEWLDNNYVDVVSVADYSAIMNSRGDFLHRVSFTL